MNVVNFSAKGEIIAVFHDRQEWVDKAQSRCSKFVNDKTQKLVFIDTNGFACNFGKNFTDAKFPVTCYRLITTSEKIENETNHFNNFDGSQILNQGVTTIQNQVVNFC